MTAYSGALQHRRLFTERGETIRHKAAPLKPAGVFIARFNFMLAAAAIIIIAFYIFMSNFLVSEKYSLNIRQTELNRINAKLAANDNGVGDYSLKELLIFAQKSGLVEAKDTDYILENDGFALNP